MRIPAIVGAALPLFILTACQDPSGPGEGDRIPGETGVSFAFDANVERSDSAIALNGTRIIRYPWRDEAVWLDRFHHFDFGGFPELGYAQERVSEAWRIQITDNETYIERNDSTILGYADHGTVTVEGHATDKLTTLPHVMPGDPWGFENFVSYLIHSSWEVTLAGGEVLPLEQADFHDRLVAGDAIEIASTGSAQFGAGSGSFRVATMATLTGIENGGVVSLEVDEPPTLRTDTSLVLEFDHPLDPERAYIMIVPFVGAPAGARGAFLQPIEAAERVVIPAPILAELLHDVAADRVAYRIFIEEFAAADDVFSGTRANGEPFMLDYGQESETSLSVWLAR